MSTHAHGPSTTRKLPQESLSSTTVKWFNVTQDNPTEVLAMVKYTSGATADEWGLAWYIFPGFERASASHPTTRFDFMATDTPPEPPACDYIETHTVTKIPGQAAPPPPKTPHGVIEEVDDGVYVLANAMTPPEQMGWLEVTSGASPDESLEMWYITSPSYEPLGPNTAQLVDVLDYTLQPPPGTPLYTLQQQVVRSYPS